MTFIIITAIIVSIVMYLYIGLSISKDTLQLSDFLPILKNRNARVNSSQEFSYSLVATTVSLATLIMAYFQLASYFGIWLLWTVFTTVLGIYIVRILGRKVWQKFKLYDEHPTLHGFLSNEFSSSNVGLVAAIFTIVGFLGVLAMELTVGSKFIASLMPAIPEWAAVIILSLIALIYTSLGGFRSVIVTDKLQMKSIFMLIFVLFLFYAVYLLTNGGWDINYAKIPDSILGFNTELPGLTSFMIGIFLINTPYYIADMSVWQKISGSQNEETVNKGLWSSVIMTAVTWTALVLLACFVFMIITPEEGVNPLLTLLNEMGTKQGIFGQILLFLSVLGLFGAMLSTASTQLIAISHTLYQDVVAKIRNIPMSELVTSKKEISNTRILLVLSTVLAVAVVEVLNYLGFSIADLVFSIYGAQLSLTPLVLFALLYKKETIRNLSSWAMIAVATGFVLGWSAAIYGKVVGNGDLVFLAPGFSLFSSLIIISIGYLLNKSKVNI